MNMRGGRGLRKLKPELSIGATPEIVFENDRPRPRIEPGSYRAYARFAKGPYLDRFTGRWTVLVLWDVMADNFDTIARDVPMFFSLGEGKRPKAGRSSRYFHEWCVANGGPPRRDDRTSPRVFTNRFARVLVRDTKRSRYDARRAPAPYSVIDKVLEWDTGSALQEFNNSTIQGGQLEKPQPQLLMGTSCQQTIRHAGNEGGSALAGVESQDNTTQGADGEKDPVRQRHHTAGEKPSQAARLRAKFPEGEG